ncbi:hypothetical protein [Ralstonia sp. 1B3]|uniref:hypothetical protein n=1 Tax=Ralstonia sp. 1B3 TaxID=2997421 RepID=UPI002FC7EF31
MGQHWADHVCRTGRCDTSAGGSTIAKRRNWRIACAAILGIGLWSGLWLGQLGLHRQVGEPISAPIAATLMTTLAAALAAFSILLPDPSASNGAQAPQRRSIAMGAVALASGCWRRSCI